MRLIKRIVRRLLGRPSYVVSGSELEGENFVGSGSVVVGIYMGRYSYCASGCSLCETYVGRFCSIGNDVQVVAAQHPTQYVSTHPFFYQPRYGDFPKASFEDFKYVPQEKLNMKRGG